MNVWDVTSFAAVLTKEWFCAILLLSEKFPYNATPKITKNKIAYVTLAEGYSLNLFDQSGKAPVEEPKKSE